MTTFGGGAGGGKGPGKGNFFNKIQEKIHFPQALKRKPEASVSPGPNEPNIDHWGSDDTDYGNVEDFDDLDPDSISSLRPTTAASRQSIPASDLLRSNPLGAEAVVSVARATNYAGKLSKNLETLGTVAAEAQNPQDRSRVNKWINQQESPMRALTEQLKDLSTMAADNLDRTRVASPVVPSRGSSIIQRNVPGPRSLSDPPVVNTANHIYSIVWGLFQALHTSNPRHPIFGPIQEGKIRAPLTAPALQNGVQLSWEGKCKQLATAIQRQMGNSLVVGSCWMIGSKDGGWQKNVSAPGESKRMVKLVSWSWVRLLHFLKVPSDSNWESLVGQLEGREYSLKTPFCHYCHNGTSSKNERRDGACINGVEHGHFGDTTFNNNQKPCRNGDASRCPGHSFRGGPSRKCVFVHPNGVLKPCLNEVAGVPAVCKHSVKCF